MTETFIGFVTSDYLTDIDTVAAYLEAAIARSVDDPATISAALGAIARSGNQGARAGHTGMSREGLHKAFPPDGNPSSATIVKVSKTLGPTFPFHTIASGRSGVTPRP
ncbi:addiction module antidote protein [Chryseoglobus sp. 28M-23]|uniref:addiction module antidote protein n=1 Tax=Chryseoglobus sp. 28M-23 TaxID=2772253 RepID=UPI001746DA80|nr:addiction module antidote protein [Chryseoglobus sp. 28M-23]QOD94556.1 putative addiction module antidote protein [Chryseoglobus sp. 28M-23]